MAVNWQYRPWLQGVQHPLALVLRRGPHIQIHPQSRRGLRLLRQVIQKAFIYLHNQFRIFSANIVKLPETESKLSIVSDRRGNFRAGGSTSS